MPVPLFSTSIVDTHFAQCPTCLWTISGPQTYTAAVDHVAHTGHTVYKSHSRTIEITPIPKP